MEWESQDSGVSINLRGLSVVSPNVAWASGVNGTVVRTKDGGKTWQELPKIKRKVYRLSIKILFLTFLALSSLNSSIGSALAWGIRAVTLGV